MLKPEQAKAMLPYLQAIADGRTVQVKSANGYFVDYPGTAPGFQCEDVEWRIKPKRFRYRVALLKPFRGGRTMNVESEGEAQGLELQPYFVKWLTDWTEVEVDS